VKHRWLIPLGFLIVLLALGLMWIGQRVIEPTYQGRTLTEWLLVYSRDPGMANEASAAVRRIGPAALPWLVSWVDHQGVTDWEARFRKWTMRLPKTWQTNSIVQTLCGSQAFTHELIVNRGFLILGTNANPVVPALTKLMKGPPHIREKAMYALSYIGEQGLPPLAAVLENPKAENRDAAAAWIGTMHNLGTNEAAAVRALARCLNDSQWDVARASALSLGKLKAQPQVAVPALVKALAHVHPPVREAAAYALGDFGAQARPAVDALQSSLFDPNTSVHVAAYGALARVAPEVLKDNSVEAPEGRVLTGTESAVVQGLRDAGYPDNPLVRLEGTNVIRMHPPRVKLQ
jgi:hypothetical protein